ncbi:hypothetical protein V8E53_007632 [Lactarius tabidus]
MPATRSTRKVTKKTPYAKPGATTSMSPNNGKTVFPELRLSTMEPDANADKGLGLVIKSKKAAVCRGKSAAGTVDAHSSDTKVDGDLVLVVNVNKGAAHQRKTGQGPSAQVKPTCALPNRPGRNVHPAGLPKSRRTKVQVEADRKATLKALEEKACKDQMAKDLFTQMNILEEDEDKDLPARYPQRLSTRINKRHYIDIENESDECFDIRVDNVSDLDSPSKSDCDKAAKAKTKHTKRIKGAAHQELLSRTKSLCLAERNEKSQAGASKLSTQEFMCKKYANAGLRPWPPTPHNAAHNQQGDTADPFEFGGLCDDDIEDMHPAIVDGPRTVVLVDRSDLTKPSRSNELVKVRSRNKDVHQSKPQAMPKPTKLKAMKSTINLSLHKGQEHEYGTPDPLSGARPDISRQCLNDVRWTHVFLPTLTHTLYISDHPFTDWTLGSSKLVETVQTVFDLSFSNISYALSLEDGIVKAAYDRMKTRRSKLANKILMLMKTFFDSAEFRNQPAKVKDYVHGALGSGGAAYYEIPVPVSCKLRKDDPNYPKPDSFLRSQFILPIAKAYIGFTAKSVLHPSLGPKHPPTGLYALILTAVEHALRAHATGAFNAPSDFNHLTTWNSMKDFYKILGRVRESHWKQAMTFDSFDDDDMECRIDESMLSAYCADFYLPSSSPTHDAY